MPDVDPWWTRAGCRALLHLERFDAVIDRDITVSNMTHHLDVLARAEMVCRGCPVRQQCLDDAITQQKKKRLPVFGVRGGHLFHGRRRRPIEWTVCREGLCGRVIPAGEDRCARHASRAAA